MTQCCATSSSAERPRAFSLLELLIIVVIMVLLIGILIPVLRRGRQQAKAVECRQQMADLMRIVTGYATDHRDLFPFGLRAPKAPGQYEMGHPPQPVDYEVAGGIWHFPVIDAFGYRTLDPALICPLDANTVQDLEAFAHRTGTDIRKWGGTLTRRMSMAMYLTPESLTPEGCFWGPRAFKVARFADVAFPSQKAALYESLPYHEPEKMENPRSPQPPPWLLVVAGTDGAVEMRNTADALAAVLPRGATRSVTAGMEAELAKFRFTARGVAGRDW